MLEFLADTELDTGGVNGGVTDSSMLGRELSPPPDRMALAWEKFSRSDMLMPGVNNGPGK